MAWSWLVDHHDVGFTTPARSWPSDRLVADVGLCESAFRADPQCTHQHLSACCLQEKGARKKAAAEPTKFYAGVVPPRNEHKQENADQIVRNEGRSAELRVVKVCMAEPESIVANA